MVSTTVANIITIVFGILVAVSFITAIVMWIRSLYGAITRKDLKNNRTLWLLFIIFAGLIGTTVYFFVEDKKKNGWISLLSSLGALILLPLWGIIQFVLSTGTSMN